MSVRAWGRCVPAAAFVAFVAGTVSSVAGEVTLKMKGGDFSVSGELQSFDNSKYTLQSKSFGVMSLDANRFDCEGAGCPQPGVPFVSLQAGPKGAAGQIPHLILSGSNTIGNQLMPAMIQAFAKAQGMKATKIVGQDPLDITFKFSDPKGNDAGSIELHRHGSSTAFQAFEQKAQIDVGMSSRRITDAEADKLQSLGYPDMRLPASEHVMGLDGLAVFVNASNPAVSLSLDNIAKIFAGTIKDWSEVGLPAGKINVYASTPASGTFDTFDNLVLKPRNLTLTDTAKRTENHAEQSDLVAADPNGIGFAGVAYERNARALNIETSCGLIVKPSIFSMKSEEYPLTRRLYLYTAGEPANPMVRAGIAFYLSPEGQNVVRDSGFVGQKPEALDFQSQTARIAYALNAPQPDFDLALMKTLISDLKPAKRLSVTLRFDIASFALDSKAVVDITRLRDLIESSDYKDKTIILAGFADGQGRFDTNLILSQKRADAVLAALQKPGNKPLSAHVITKAYSQLAPVACNGTPESRFFNRRVEVWVK